ncbi:hypothetical protein ABPG74_020791 [Tetrahymena malaccensis]
MSKKLGTNPKAQEAREREKEQKKQARIIEEERKEAAKWAESDKNVLKKLDRQQEKEKQKEEERKRNEEKRALYEEDQKQFKDKQTLKKEEDRKLTKAELKKVELEIMKREAAKRMGIDLDELKKEKKEAEKQKKEKEQEKQEKIARGEEVEESDDDDFNVKPNLNHVRREQALQDAEKYDKVIDATGLDNALEGLKDEQGIKHPEKKVKAAWEEFLEKRLPEMKAEYPHFKRSKHIELLRKEWDKSPDNPFNQKTLSYDEKKQ